MRDLREDFIRLRIAAWGRRLKNMSSGGCYCSEWEALIDMSLSIDFIDLCRNGPDEWDLREYLNCLRIAAWSGIY